jgi:hypothetical protein
MAYLQVLEKVLFTFIISFFMKKWSFSTTKNAQHRKILDQQRITLKIKSLKIVLAQALETL